MKIIKYHILPFVFIFSILDCVGQEKYNFGVVESDSQLMYGRHYSTFYSNHFEVINHNFDSISTGFERDSNSLLPKSMNFGSKYYVDSKDFISIRNCFDSILMKSTIVSRVFISLDSSVEYNLDAKWYYSNNYFAINHIRDSVSTLWYAPVEQNVEKVYRLFFLLSNHYSVKTAGLQMLNTNSCWFEEQYLRLKGKQDD
ncbi:MAG: hypothetical protein COA58_04745 [Bacteroidetes bacterium]|nr:MAG: hypothetical protein COA58_04745 [Bacteroidota bacterium]